MIKAQVRGSLYTLYTPAVEKLDVFALKTLYSICVFVFASFKSIKTTTSMYVRFMHSSFFRCICNKATYM
jgi:hypothetical protein